MATLMFALMMQFLISAKAGQVNYVEGDVNLKVLDGVQSGQPIKTGPGGFAEILLNPGSYLRLGANSEAVLDGIELTDIRIRIVSGSAVIEAAGFDKKSPLHVTIGKLETVIVKNGIYEFSDGKARVIEGQLQVTGNKSAFKKGWQVAKDEALEAVKISKRNPTPLEGWSRNRSELIAEANNTIARSLNDSRGFASLLPDSWIWVPAVRAFTFMPGDRYRSPYGYHYRTFYDVTYAGGRGYGDASNSRGDAGAADASGAAGGNAGDSGFSPVQSQPAPRDTIQGRSTGGAGRQMPVEP